MLKFKKILLGCATMAFFAWSVFSCADQKDVPNEYNVISSIEEWIKINEGEEFLTNYKVDDGLYLKIMKNVDNRTDYREAKPNDSSFVFVNYQVARLDGTMAANTYEDRAIQLGQFSWVRRYIPFMFQLNKFGAYPGLSFGHYRALLNMNAGDSAVLYVAERYGYNNFGFDGMFVGFRGNTTLSVLPSKITLKLEHFSDKRQLEAKAENDLITFASQNSLTFIDRGIFMRLLKTNSNAADSVRSDSTLDLNFIGRFIPTAKYPQFVFDTNIRDTAERYNIFDAKRGYTPSKYRYNKNDSLEYGGLIKPFKAVISRMKLGERVLFITSYDQAYGADGRYEVNGSIIYPFTPIIFEFEIIKKDDE